jgi:hypothetical protein
MGSLHLSPGDSAAATSTCSCCSCCSSLIPHALPAHRSAVLAPVYLAGGILRRGGTPHALSCPASAPQRPPRAALRTLTAPAARALALDREAEQHAWHTGTASPSRSPATPTACPHNYTGRGLSGPCRRSSRNGTSWIAGGCVQSIPRWPPTHLSMASRIGPITVCVAAARPASRCLTRTVRGRL